MNVLIKSKSIFFLSLATILVFSCSSGEDSAGDEIVLGKKISNNNIYTLEDFTASPVKFKKLKKINELLKIGLSKKYNTMIIYNKVNLSKVKFSTYSINMKAKIKLKKDSTKLRFNFFLTYKNNINMKEYLLI